MAGTIMLVDDEFDLRFMMYNYFRIVGYNILTADDATQAMRVASENHLDAIVLDVNLRSGDSSKLLAFLRANHASVPVILSTSLPKDDPTVMNMLDQGAMAHVCKGDALEDLLTVVQKATKQPPTKHNS